MSTGTPRPWWQQLIDRTVHHWPRKLAALAVAVVLWLVLTSTEGSTAQTSLVVPIVVEGLAEDQVAVGLPTQTTVSVSGPTARVNRLRQENFEAVLDLAGLSGEFNVSIQVSPPQGIILEAVSPSEVFGVLEALTSRTVPVVVTVIGDAGEDQRLLTSADPAEATVHGRAAVVAQASSVLAPVPGGSGAGVLSVAPYAVDANGRPLPELTVEPLNVAVSLQRQQVRIERRVPLSLLPIFADGWSEPQNPSNSVLLVGPQSVLQELEQVVGVASLPTEPPADGRYTLPLTLTLPAGVVALETAVVSLGYQGPVEQTEPEPDATPEQPPGQAPGLQPPSPPE